VLGPNAIDVVARGLKLLTPTMLTRLLLFLGVIWSTGLLAADDDLAVAIVYDTSGSMQGPVRTAGGKSEPKYLVGNRALETIVARLEKFSAGSGRKLHVGVFTFSLKGANPVVPVGPFEPEKIRAWLKDAKPPQGGTPLGNATEEAARALLKQKAGSRHVLVITDGENTIGEPPEKKMTGLLQEALKSGQALYFHFVAFDVQASHFAPVKKLGATLLSAADEAQLNDRLSFVLDEKILLEKE
jgi:uncharacterized protein YegL